MAGFLSYSIEIFKGKVRPNRITWLLWGLIPMVAFVAQILEGVGWPSLMTFAVGLFPLIIFAISVTIKKSEWKITQFDIVCACISIMGIILFYLF